MPATAHASAVLAGRHAILIRGAAGSGKSRLAMALIETARGGGIPLARLVADDRVELQAVHGRLLARAPAALAGMIEVRGLGIRRIAHEPVAVVGLVVDLGATDAQRLPAPATAELAGISLPRLAVAAGVDPAPLVLSWLGTEPA